MIYGGRQKTAWCGSAAQVYGVLVLLALMMGWGPQARASEPMDIRVVRDAGVEDYDFSWAFWFETRGRRYLYEGLTDRPLPWETPATRRWRGEAIAALERLIEDQDDAVRAQAILALARIGHEPVVDRVLGEADGERVSLLLDESAAVRRMSWAALGVVGTEQARLAMGVEPLPQSTEADRAAQAMAIGLLQTHERVHEDWLVRRIADRSESPEVKRWSLWSMRRLGLDEASSAAGVMVRTLPSVFVLSEALLSPGAWLGDGRAAAGEDDEQAIAGLTEVLVYGASVRDWPGYVALSAMPSEGRFGSSPRRLAMETRVSAALSLMDADRPEQWAEREQLLAVLRGRIVPGNSEQAMDFTRGFDALAYAMHCDLMERDLLLLTDWMLGIAVLAKDDPAVAEKMERRGAAGGEPTAFDRREGQVNNELRGYAAIAAGLLMRRATDGTDLALLRPIENTNGSAVEAFKRRFGRQLLRGVSSRREPVSYRAACALALGLSGDRRYASGLSKELSKLRGGDEAVLGYGLLALAMLGEQRVVDPAGRYVGRPGAVGDAGDRLGRRAALRAIGLTSWKPEGEGGAALSSAWGRDPWVGLDVAEATAWLGEYDAVPAMLTSASSESAAWRQSAARGLGIVFDRSHPSHLSAVLATMNPTLSLRPIASDRRAPVANAEGLPQEMDPSAGWPIGELYAAADPFVVEMMRSRAEPEPEQPEEPAADDAVTPPVRLPEGVGVDGLDLEPVLPD